MVKLKEGERARNKIGVTKSERIAATKDRRQGMDIPVSVVPAIEKLIKKLELRGYQVLFDYLVVSGVVFLKREIIEIINEHADFYRERSKKASLARLKKEKTDHPEMKQVIVTMYQQDMDALNRFCVEQNLKKYWIFEILMREFAKENPVLLAHIDNCKKLNIATRKKQLARLGKEEYIKVLSPIDAESILERNTENYDKAKFSKLLQQEINDILARSNKALFQFKVEEKQEDILEAKIRSLRKERIAAEAEITEPVIDEDDDT